MVYYRPTTSYLEKQKFIYSQKVIEKIDQQTRYWLAHPQTTLMFLRTKKQYATFQHRYKKTYIIVWNHIGLTFNSTKKLYSLKNILKCINTYIHEQTFQVQIEIIILEL